MTTKENYQLVYLLCSFRILNNLRILEIQNFRLILNTAPFHLVTERLLPQNSEGSESGFFSACSFRFLRVYLRG
jgi:hypothetical protein